MGKSKSLSRSCKLDHAGVFEERFKLLLEVLVVQNHVSPVQADNCIRQYNDLLANGAFKNDAQKFCKVSERIDDLYVKHISEGDDLWHVIKIVLNLGHGNARAESGFSINLDLLLPNLQQDSMVSLRLVYDAL